MNYDIVHVCGGGGKVDTVEVEKVLSIYVYMCSYLLQDLHVHGDRKCQHFMGMCPHIHAYTCTHTHTFQVLHVGAV